MTLNQLIKEAVKISRRYTSGDIPLRMYGKDVVIRLTEKSTGESHYIDIQFQFQEEDKT